MNAVLLIGRILFAILFVALASVAIILGGLWVALGIYADLGALILALFALAGAALVLFVVIGRHADIGWHVTSPFFNFK